MAPLNKSRGRAPTALGESAILRSNPEVSSSPLSPANRSFGYLAVCVLFLSVGFVGEARSEESPASETSLAKTVKEEAPVVTFAGFRVHEDGSSTLRVDLTKRADVTLTREGKTLVYWIEGAKIRYRNNENPLDTKHFESNVVSAKLDRARKGVKFTVRLRTDTSAQHRIIEHSTGVSLQVDVPVALSSQKPVK